MSEINKYYPLSGYEMIALNPDATVLKYNQLYNFKTIDDLFKYSQKIIILFETKNNIGHWITIFKNEDGINFFDSYGLDLDEQQKFITKSKLKELNQQYKYLKKISKDIPIYYNNVIFQNKKVLTCGCHVSYRLYNSHMTLRQYVEKLFIEKQIKDPDLFVSSWCIDRLKNKLIL